MNTRTGDFNATSVAHVVNTDSINKLVVKAWLDRAGKRRRDLTEIVSLIHIIAQRKSTLVFCVNLAHVRDLTAAFREAGVDARYLHAGTPAAERKALIADFRAGVFPVLLNCGELDSALVSVVSSYSLCLAILTEGADIPNIDCVVVAKPTRSRNVFAQMVS